MGNRSIQRVILCIFILFLSPFTMGMGQLGAARSGSAGGLFSYIPHIMILIILLIPFLKAYIAAKQAEVFKTLVFITTFYEWLGWIVCCTIIGLPIGLGLVLVSQITRVLIKIEANTNQTLKLMKIQKEDRN